LPRDGNYDKITDEARTLAGYYNRQLVHLLRRTSLADRRIAVDYLSSPLATAPKTTHCRGDVQPFAPSPSTP
jgi:hypothetical protein